MDEKQLKQLVEEEKLPCPANLLTDVGTYCYTALTSVALNMLYDGKEDKNNSQFVENTVKCLTAHLKQPKRVADTALMIAKSVDIQNYQPFIETLKKEEIIEKEGCSVVPKDLVLVGLQEGCYDSRMRTLIKFVSLMLNVPWEEIEEYENFVVQTYKEQEHVLTEEEEKEKASKAKVRKIKKYALIGAATVGGGVLVGLTGGLAAPFIAAGAGAVIGTAGAAALGSTAGIAIIGSLFGAAGAGLGGYKMNKRVGDVEEFTFEPLSEGSQLHVTIAITGWIKEEFPDFTFPWRGLDNSKEQYVLRYESKYLTQLGSAMDYLVSFAVSQATTEALKYTVLASLMAAIVWPAAIIAAAGVIDNPWSVLTNRSQQAGKMLAEVLLSRQQGRRPVTLVGFSLGARVIYYCLQELAKRKNSEGIIEDAIMLGTPAPANPKDWALLKRVVAGKIVNGYCRGDWLLKFLYRTASVQFSIAGLEPVKWTDRRMHNIDLSEVVDGHMDYMNKLDHILDIVGIKTKPHATERTGNNLKQWVTANKSNSFSRDAVTGVPISKSADAVLKTEDIEVEVAEDPASTLGAHAATEPEMSRLFENENIMADTVAAKEDLAAELTNILPFADALVLKAVSEAKDSVKRNVASSQNDNESSNGNEEEKITGVPGGTLLSGDDDASQNENSVQEKRMITEGALLSPNEDESPTVDEDMITSNNRDISLQVPHISSLPSMDSGIGSSVAQEEDDDSSIKAKTNNNVKELDQCSEEEKVNKSLNELHMDNPSSCDNKSDLAGIPSG